MIGKDTGMQNVIGDSISMETSTLTGGRNYKYFWNQESARLKASVIAGPTLGSFASPFSVQPCVMPSKSCTSKSSRTV